MLICHTRFARPIKPNYVRFFLFCPPTPILPVMFVAPLGASPNTTITTGIRHIITLSLHSRDVSHGSIALYVTFSIAFNVYRRSAIYVTYFACSHPLFYYTCSYSSYPSYSSPCSLFDYFSDRMKSRFIKLKSSIFEWLLKLPKTPFHVVFSRVCSDAASHPRYDMLLNLVSFSVFCVS